MIYGSVIVFSSILGILFSRLLNISIFKAVISIIIISSFMYVLSFILVYLGANELVVIITEEVLKILVFVVIFKRNSEKFLTTFLFYGFAETISVKTMFIAYSSQDIYQNMNNNITAVTILYSISSIMHLCTVILISTCRSPLSIFVCFLANLIIHGLFNYSRQLYLFDFVNEHGIIFSILEIILWSIIAITGITYYKNIARKSFVQIN